MGFTTPSNYSTVDANAVPRSSFLGHRGQRRDYTEATCDRHGMQDGTATLQKLYPTDHRFANPHKGRQQSIRRASRFHFGAEDAKNGRTAPTHRGPQSTRTL